LPNLLSVQIEAAELAMPEQNIALAPEA
jgi:hypothetical protein